uniref:Cytochrome P450 n=1 Tax=Timema monikensis TaxID=170555 RepID=A0A7R9E7N4_9NEOP|nr:unnamed protein product [Timema monikensis]
MVTYLLSGGAEERFLFEEEGIETRLDNEVTPCLTTCSGYTRVYRGGWGGTIRRSMLRNVVETCRGLLDVRGGHTSPSWLPVLGNLLHLKRLVQTTGFHHLAWERLSQQYGPVVGLKLGMTPPLILVSGHRAVTQTLNMEELDGRPDGFVFRFRTMGERRGVIFTDGEVWKEQRRFSLRNLREFGFGKRSMEALISEEARSLLMRLMEVGAAAGPEGVPMHLVFTLPVLNSLWSLTAGMRYSDEDAKLQQFINLLNEMTRSVDSTGGILNYLPSLRFLAPGLTGFDKFSSSQNKMWSFFMDIVKDHRETLSSDHARDLIDVFLQEMDLQKGEEGTSFTESQLVALCKDLFAAGSETTSNTLSFAIMFMVLNPAVQTRVHTELDEVVGRSRPPSLDDRNKLPFVSAVLMETQRMSNVGPVSLPHRALADTQIDGYFIPKDSTLLMSLWSCHMDPSHWGDPHNFRPDRFLNGKELLPADPWLLPFGTGRRRCLGETMARNSLFLFFTALLQNLTFSLPHGATPPCPQGVNGFTLNTQPYHAVIHSRR